MGRDSLASVAPAPSPLHPILDPEKLLGGPLGRGGECDLLGKGRTGLSPLPALTSPNFLGLFPAAPREQHLRHHQVPTHCPCGATS